MAEPGLSEDEFDTFARVSVALAAGRPLEALLQAHGLERAGWDALQTRASGLLSAEAMAGGLTPLADRYCEAVARAGDELALPELTPEAWAELAVAVAARGLDALADHAVDPQLYPHLARRWAERLTRDADAGQRYAAAFARLSRPAS